MKLKDFLLSKPAPVEEPEPMPAAKTGDLSNLKQTDLVAFNSKVEPRFVELVRSLIAEGDITPYIVIQEAAFELNVSVSTAKRYLIKHTARRGEFAIVDGFVRFKTALF